MKLVFLPIKKGQGRWINPEQVTQLLVFSEYITVYLSDGHSVQTELTLEKLRELLAQEA
jgi:hypothetical protein